MSKFLLDDKKTVDCGGLIDLTARLSEDFNKLYLNENFSDVTFIIENERIPCHKVILAARSEYFRGMLYGGLNESNKSEISLKIQKDAFKVLLKFIYTGKINLRSLMTPQMNLLLDTLALANLFEYTELKDEISSFLKNSLKLSNVCNILDASRLYELDELTNICYTFIDKNAEELLAHESFKYLYKDSLIALLSRDSLYVNEIKIFKAVQKWMNCNTDLKAEDMKQVVSQIRLPLISTIDLLSVVRLTAIPDPATEHGAEEVEGCKFSIFEDDPFEMESECICHDSTDNNSGIVIQLANIFIINHIRILLWDLDSRSYSYVIDVAVEENFWERVIDYSSYPCRSWQYLYFPIRPVKYIRIKGTHNTVNEVFQIESLICTYTSNVPAVVDGIIAPKYNVATVFNSAMVLNEQSRSRKYGNYDFYRRCLWMELGGENIFIQLGQPYLIDSFRILLMDCDDRTNSFYIETSSNNKLWEIVVDKRSEKLQPSQSFKFKPRIISCIRIVGTSNSANAKALQIHFECPSQEPNDDDDGDF